MLFKIYIFDYIKIETWLDLIIIESYLWPDLYKGDGATIRRILETAGNDD